MKKKLLVVLVVVAVALLAFGIQASAATAPAAQKIWLYEEGASAPFKTLDLTQLNTYYNTTSGEYDIDDLIVPAGTKIDIKVFANSVTTRCTIDGDKASGTYSKGFTGTVSSVKNDRPKNFEIVLQDGTSSSSTKTTYNISWEGSSVDTKLSKLSLKASSSKDEKALTLYPNFDKNYDGEYYVFIPYKSSNAYDTLIFNIAAADKEVEDITIVGDGDSVNVDGYKDTSLDYDLEGDNEVIVITVISEGLERQYILNVFYSDDSSKDCNLDDLYVEADGDDVKLSPKFSASTTTYSASVDEDVEEAVIGFEAEDDYCMVLVSCGDYTEIFEYEEDAEVELAEGKNEVTITVFAANYSTTKTYTINLYRGDSDNNYLSGISLKDSSGNNITLTPNFAQTTYTYTATVANSVTQIAAKALLGDSNATMKINNALVENETWSNYITLGAGSNVIKFVVTAPDGTDRTYQVTVTKEGKPTQTLNLYIGKNTAYVGSSAVMLDAAPFLYTYGGVNYTMVPIRFIGEQGLGATVTWNAASKSVTIVKGDKTISMTLGVINTASGMVCPPVAKNNRIFVPIRYVAESMGCTVNYTSVNLPIVIIPQ
jgi:hypothetical protein